MKQNIFLIILLCCSISVFSQKYRFNSCELPSSNNGGYITLKPMTGIILIKEYKIFSYCANPKEKAPEHYASVDLSANKLNIKIYDANGKLIIAHYPFGVSFQKDLSRSVKGETDENGYTWGRKNVFILKTNNPSIGGDVTMENLGGKILVTIHYYVKNEKGVKNTDYTLYYEA